MHQRSLALQWLVWASLMYVVSTALVTEFVQLVKGFFQLGTQAQRGQCVASLTVVVTANIHALYKAPVGHEFSLSGLVLCV